VRTQTFLAYKINVCTPYLPAFTKKEEKLELKNVYSTNNSEEIQGEKIQERTRAKK